jgi:hypothetical protein
MVVRAVTRPSSPALDGSGRRAHNPASTTCLCPVRRRWEDPEPVIRRCALLCALTCLALGLPFQALAGTAANNGVVSSQAGPSSGYARLDRVIEAESSGIARPAAIAWASSLQRLVILDSARPGSSTLAPLLGDASPGIVVAGGADHVALAFETALDRLVAVNRSGTEIRSTQLTGAAAGRWTATALALGGGGPVQVDGLAIAAGNLWVLDGRAGVLYRIPTAGATFQAGSAQRLAVGSIGLDARGLAVDPRSGHLFVLASAGHRLLELDASGTPLVTRDLAAIGLHDPRGIVIAPSGDPTDPSEQESLYVADAGAIVSGQTIGAGVYEVSLTEPLLAPSLADATVDTATVVQTINTAQWSPASPDPSGMDYIPYMDRLVVSDGEVEETTGAGWHGVNVWLARRQGGAPDGYMNTLQASPTNNEPAAAAYDQARNELYFGKDGSNSAVWVYGPGNDGDFGTPDDQQLRYFTTSNHGVSDGEGLAFGNGKLYVADGTGKEIWAIAPGNDGIVGTGDDAYSHFDVLSLGQNNPEGLDFDSSTGNLWVVSNDNSSGALEVTPAGVPVSTLARSQIPALHPGGLASAPSSVDNSTPNVWIGDRGVDNNSDPSENDGKIIELSISGGPPPPPPGGNIIVNGDFEAANAQGQPTSWTLDTRFSRSSAVVHGGTYAGRHQAADNSGYKVTQDVSASAGQAYDFSGWVDVPTTSDPFKIVLKVQWRTASGAISTVTLGKVTKSTTGWVRLTKALTAPAGATIARAMMVISSLNATIYVDDFELTALP